MLGTARGRDGTILSAGRSVGRAEDGADLDPLASPSPRSKRTVERNLLGAYRSGRAEGPDTAIGASRRFKMDFSEVREDDAVGAMEEVGMVADVAELRSGRDLSRRGAAEDDEDAAVPVDADADVDASVALDVEVELDFE